VRRNLITLLVWLLYLPAKSQFNDSFQDGSLLTDPDWIFNSSDFEILNGRLHTTNSNGGVVQYGISSRWDLFGAEVFDFEFELLANPSSGNYIDLFVGADTIVELAKNGYFIRIGDLKDEISFYKLVNGVKTELISGADGELNKSSNHYHVRLYRNRPNAWQLIYRNMVSASYDSVGQVFDSSFSNLGFTGIKIVQNGTTIIGKHYFDNLRFGKHIPDTIPPKMVSLQVVFPNLLQVSFQEPIGQLAEDNFYLTGIGNPALASVSGNQPNLVNLSFSSAFEKNKTYTLQNQFTEDLKGNKSFAHQLTFITRFLDTPEQGDITITEIMANPSPSLGTLPELEYLEIKNNGPKYLRLKNCRIADANNSMYLPDSVLPPYSYAVICKNTATSLATAGGIWIGVPAFLSLNNDADDLFLYNAKGQLLHALHYSENWHSNSLKRNGGWSLEMVDTLFGCVNTNNWQSNNSAGGTPGKINSVARALPAKPKFKVLRSYCPDNQTIRLYFTENPDSIGTIKEYFKENATGTFPARIDNFDPLQHSCDLLFANSFAADVAFTLSIQQLRSCFGESIEQQTILCGWINSSIFPGDLYINEILFDPRENDADYVELFNASDKILDLRHLLVANRDASGTPMQSETVAAEGYTLYPHSYVWISSDPESIISRYPFCDSVHFIFMPDMPTFSNDKGSVAIYTSNTELIDGFDYADDMHSPILASADGVSLEKTTPNAASNDQHFWTSAASSVNFGTPGLKNSQSIGTGNSGEFVAEDGYFTPDNDGNKDLLRINFRLAQPGFYLNAKIFSESGSYIANPYNNYSLAESGTLVWDGKTDNGAIYPGNYVMFLEGFHVNGKKFRHKIEFAVLANQ
jgi:hypothetical protein